MHSPATRSEFLRLRVSGLSFARISRQLGVSKPTLVAWSRQSQPQIASRLAQADRQITSEVTESAATELANLNRHLTAIKQELFSRAIRDIPTPCLEKLCGELTDRLRQLESLSVSASPLSPGPHRRDSFSEVPLTNNDNQNGQGQNSSINSPVRPVNSGDGISPSPHRGERRAEEARSEPTTLNQ